MAFADQLLEQAHHLAMREKTRPRQVSLRRAVSTAYYALFHLLIHEATANWKRPTQRPLLARAFEHGRMRSVCQAKRSELAALVKQTHSSPAIRAARHLHTVTEIFVRLQGHRHTADYDNSVRWARIEVLGIIEDVNKAFSSWKSIRNDDLAQDFLIFLLIRDR
jgi:uncharacterized protein (UPF0332 family)